MFDFGLINTTVQRWKRICVPVDLCVHFEQMVLGLLASNRVVKSEGTERRTKGSNKRWRDKLTFWFSPISFRMSELTTVLVMDLWGDKVDWTIKLQTHNLCRRLIYRSFCFGVCSIPGFSGEVLTEVFHNVERIDSRSSEDASGCLETEVYKRKGGWIGRERVKEWKKRRVEKWEERTRNRKGARKEKHRYRKFQPNLTHKIRDSCLIYRREYKSLKEKVSSRKKLSPKCITDYVFKVGGINSIHLRNMLLLPPLMEEETSTLWRVLMASVFLPCRKSCIARHEKRPLTRRTSDALIQLFQSRYWYHNAVCLSVSPGGGEDSELQVPQDDDNMSQWVKEACLDHKDILRH